MSLSYLENQHLPRSLTQTVSVEEWGTTSWPPLLLTLSDNNSSTLAIYYFAKMSPRAQAPYLAMPNWGNAVSVWLNVIRREREGVLKIWRKIRNESKFMVASRLTSFGGFTSQGVNTSHYAALLLSNDVRWPLSCRADANRCKTLLCVVFKTRKAVNI